MEYQTRQWLEEALFDLLATKKSLHNISIAELSEHAQIARRTFYRYYHSKEQVLTNYLDRLIQDYIIELQTEKLTNFNDLVNLFFQYWIQYTETLKILQDANLLVLVLQRYYDKLPAAYTTVTAPWHITNSDQRQITYDSRFIIGGLYSIFDEWLKTDHQTMPVSELVTTALNIIKRMKDS
ncbi:TetR/AcrR family transcriptional regulator [Streptococcus mutans]|uniref:TetR/AcrR family transcriptional regulator n=1 Tax=Streptococcus mutans TaxID=1309 RepID=UPI0002B54A0A|nr:TetR/AcrR family transcriptional regulator [Streptococcus mutans]EMC54125.1 putative transcriptional regulator [Streptococcus mutans SF12]